MSLSLFRVGNFLSIKDTVELSFIPNEEFGTKKGCIEDGLLQIAALFGANASGKTNIVLAFDYLRYLIIGKHSNISTKNLGRLGGNVSCPFNESDVTRFELYFKALHQMNMSYTLEYDSSKNEVVREDLTIYESDSKIENILVRNGLQYQLSSNWMDTDIIAAVNSHFNEHDLMKDIPAVKQFHDINRELPPIILLMFEIESIRILTIDEYDRSNLGSIFGLDSLRTLSEFLKDLTDITAIYLRDTKEPDIVIDPFSTNLPKDEYGLKYDNERIMFAGLNNKKIYDVLFSIGSSNALLNIKQLSSGVVRIIDIVMRIMSSKRYSKDQEVNEMYGITETAIRILDGNMPDMYIYDEICSALHPTIVNRLVHKILKMEPKSQFILTFHETEFLVSNDVRRDEIWFVEKTNNITTVESLDQYERDSHADIKRNYLDNRYEGTPRFNGELD